MKESKDVITFEVDETLFFENGQEIAEMIAISLDPNISIQTSDSDIQVHGEIVLQGEYVKVEESPVTTAPLSELTNYVREVVDTEENQAKFTHHFPVEISIPPYRVDNLEDVTVTIDSFDYELPSEGKLKIKSSVHINGIKQDIAIEDEQDVSNEQGSGEIETEKTIADEITDVEFIEQPLKQDQEEESTEQIEQTDSSERLETGENEIDIQLSESEEEEEEVKDVRFLTDLFGNEEEETYATMRIYIAQEDDTIETIAKRYGVSVLQLVKDNNLSGETIEEGQLLQLPVLNE